MNLPRPSRWISADDIVSGRVFMDQYPFRYFCLYVQAGFVGAASLDLLLTAVEMLETRGWELVQFEPGPNGGSRGAHMRRVTGAQAGSPDRRA